MILSLKPISPRSVAAGCVVLAMLGLLVVHRYPGTESSEPSTTLVVGQASASSGASTGVSAEREPRRQGDGETAGRSPGVPQIEISPEFDFAKYPRGLRSAVDEVLETGQQGRLAFELASILGKCRRVGFKMDLILESLPAVHDSHFRKYYEASYAALQKLEAQCQTLGGDLAAIRIELLELARQSGIESSAAELYGEGVTHAQVQASILSDARAGDLSSILQVALGGRGEAKFTEAQVTMNRYVLLLAQGDPVTGPLVAPLVSEVQRMGVVQRLAPGQAGETEARLQAALASKTDVLSQSAVALDEAGKQEARATLQRMLKRLARSTT